MSQNMYELIALGARYAFSALMVLIVLRAWRITIVDSRRANTLRRMSPDTGLSGELIVMEGDGKARRGMRYPVTREGMIGTARRADIRIRHSSVRRRHAYFQMTEDGLSVRAHAGAPMRLGRGRPVKEAVLKDGDYIDIGRVRLMLVLAESPEPARQERPPRQERRRRDRARGPEADWPEDALFEENPVLNRMPENRSPRGGMSDAEDADQLFDIDE